MSVFNVTDNINDQAKKKKKSIPSKSFLPKFFAKTFSFQILVSG